MGDIVKHNGDGDLAAPASGNFLQMVVEAARDTTVNAEKMQAMANLAIQLQTHEQRQQFSKDKVAALMDMPTISKRGRIVIPGRDGRPAREQGRFAKFEDIMAVVKPILAAHNLVISFRTGSEGPMVTCAPVLTHRNGYEEVGDFMKFPIDNSGSKNPTQGVGSAASYAKRQAAKAALNIVEQGEDDDGMGTGDTQFVAMDGKAMRLLAAANRAVAEGKYPEWFPAQNAADRGWLVQTGHHALLGGAPVELAGGDQPEQPSNPPPGSGSRADDDAARKWVDSYLTQVIACETLDALVQLQEDERRSINRVKEGYPDLNREIIAEHSKAYDRLTEGGA